GGLAKTDIGARGHEVLGGMAAEIYSRIQDAEITKGACPGSCTGTYDLEAHVAEQVFEEMLEEAGVVVERNVRLLDVRKDGATIESVSTSRGELPADVFIDASYEGDLMALAGVSYRI